MKLEIIGPHPFARVADGQQPVRIGTIFPAHRALYTEPPGVHARQRMGFIEHLNARRNAEGKPSLDWREESDLCRASVDLFFEPDQILIRPYPDRMELAFAADELLCQLVSKRRVKFLLVHDVRVREAIKERGECWRLSSIPKTREGRQALIFNSRVAIQNSPIYFYNRLTGTRYLTFDEFEKLGARDDTELARHLQEIADYSPRKNEMNEPELKFFAADIRAFGKARFADLAFEAMTPGTLRAKYEELRERFRSAVHEAYRKDAGHKPAWSSRMVEALFLDGNESATEQIQNDLSAEFRHQVEWLPGGRIAEGEFIPDSVLEEAAANPADAELQRLCDPGAKGIIFNFLREYGDFEFINVGRLPESLSLNRPQDHGRRGVYLVVFKSRSEAQPIKRFIRMQKWGVWERLDEGKDLLAAIKGSDEYTDYCLDRRLGCRQLGMNLTRRVMERRMNEVYLGTHPGYRGQTIRTPYFERDYLEGTATDKLPSERYALPGYGAQLAKLLGQAAASSLIVGRALDLGTQPVFDDGDEVVIEQDGLPDKIFVTDHSGAFGEYQKPLETYAEHYAQPVARRANFLTEPREFAEAYLEALREQFVHVQSDYRRHRPAFDGLFNDRNYDKGGGFAYRWQCVLERLDATNADQLVFAIREKIRVLNEPRTSDAELAMLEPAGR